MIPLAVIAAGRAWWKAALGAAVIFPAAFLLGQCHGEGSARARFERQAAQAREAAAAANTARVERQALDREAETAALNQTREDLNRADDAIPDSRPSDKRRAALCARVRDLHRTGAAVPVALRSQCEAGAEPGR